MNIYLGKNYEDLKQAMPGIPFFEELNRFKTSAEYPECWAKVAKDADIICKTEDAVRCAPLDAKLIRVVRSKRAADAGQIVMIEMTVSEFIFLLDDVESGDRRVN